MTVAETNPIANEPDDYPQNGSGVKHRPPNDIIAAEYAVINACLYADQTTVDNATSTGLLPEHFTNVAYGHIWRAMQDVAAAGHNPEPVLIADQLAHNQVDGIGVAFLVQLTLDGPAAYRSNIAAYAEIVIDRRHRTTAITSLIAAIDQIRLGGQPLPLISRIIEHLPAPPGDDLFHPWTPAELLAADTGFTWLVEGMYAQPTYGMTAGESKTAKTTIGVITQMAIAAGLPVLGRFNIRQPRPVVVYIGEGGRIPHTRLLARVAEAMGIDWQDLPIHPRYEVAPINSDRFQHSLRRDLDTINPGLVVIDPYYAFHGSTADSKNLHEEAEVLNAASSVCVEADAVLDITNHFNRNEGKGLRRITMAGGAEWVDTWRLVEHREPADIDNGQLQLRLEIGSRQWGGSVWDLDLNLGRFLPDIGLYDGPISWDLRRPGKPVDSRVDTVLTAVENAPYAYTKEELAKLVGGRADDARKLVDHLENGTKQITPKLVIRHDTLGRERKTWAYGPTPRPAPDDASQEEE